MKRRFGCEIALVGDLGPSCARCSSSWARLGCSFGALNASGWQVRFPRIPPNFHKSKFNSQTSVFQKSPFSRCKIEVFENGGGNPDFHNLLGRPPYTVFYDGFWHFARVRLRNNNFTSKAIQFQKSRFTVVKLQFLKVRERKTRILNNFLNSIHCFGVLFLATFMDFYLIYFVVVSQNVVYLVWEPLGADFELPSRP